MHILTITDATSFCGCVQRDDGKQVYQIHGREIIKSGVMRSEDDVGGLTAHLTRLKVIPYGDSVIAERRATTRTNNG